MRRVGGERSMVKRIALALGALAACHRDGATAPDAALAAADANRDAPISDAGVALIVVPATTGPIDIDGDWTEPDWNQRAVQLVFTDSQGQQARPYSEVRLLHDDTMLYLGMYAADEDIELSDFFQTSLASLVFRINPRGTVEASSDVVNAAAEYDGTLDDPDDYDEEWLLEASVPLSAIGLTGDAAISLIASRCDVTKDGELHCGGAMAPIALVSMTAGTQ